MLVLKTPSEQPTLYNDHAPTSGPFSHPNALWKPPYSGHLSTAATFSCSDFWSISKNPLTESLPIKAVSLRQSYFSVPVSDPFTQNHIENLPQKTTAVYNGRTIPLDGGCGGERINFSVAYSWGLNTRPSSLVPRRSQASRRRARSTRKGLGTGLHGSCCKPFGDVTKFRGKSSEREGNAWVLGLRPPCFKLNNCKWSKTKTWTQSVRVVWPVPSG